MKIVTFGEVMLRLSPPNYQKIEQATQFEAIYGGCEANVAISLAHFGVQASHITAFPDNALGKSAMQYLRQQGVETKFIRFENGRLGLYFLETGLSIRASQIVYDRYDSAFSNIKPNTFDWDEILKDADWFHWSGITPALSLECAQSLQKALNVAHKKKIFVSADVYFRSNLWRYGKTPQEILPSLVSKSNLILANENNMEELFGIEKNKKDANTFVESAKKIQEKYPSVQKIVDTERISHSATHNEISAKLWDGKNFLETNRISINPILDRIGGGDAFVAGLIYGLMTYKGDQKALNFGICASALKHTISGDANIATVQEVENLMQGDFTGKLKR
jgi:2-dehydro-3-deoxygluconokinase